jgi:plastocyanin
MLGLVVVAGGVLAACGNDDDTGGSASGDAGDGARSIEVNAESFQFEPPEIRIAAGEEVTVEFTAEDVFHTFTVEDADVNIESDSGETTEGTVSFDEPGEHTFFCSVPGHREAGMEGTIIVE